jgi:two-component sensor histidine kinase
MPSTLHDEDASLAPRERWQSRLPRLLALMFYVDELRTQMPPWGRYLTATIAAGIVYGLRLAIFEPQETSYPYLFAFPAIVFSSALLGLGPALLAAVLGGVLPLVLMPGQELTPREDFTRLVGIGAYAVTALLLTVLVRGFALARVTAEGSVREADVLNRQLGSLLVEKEGLLGTTNRLLLELRHRTKNELAQVVAMLHFQARVAATEEEKAALVAMAARVRSVGHVHDMLSRQMDRPDQPVRSDEFLTGLISQVRDAGRGGEGIVWDINLQRHDLPHTTATPLGLMITELATNIQKHAFPDGPPGMVTISFRRDGTTYVLVVEDDGVGVAKAVSNPSGIGKRVLQGVTRNLGGKLVTSVPLLGAGTRCELRFPVPSSAPPSLGIAPPPQRQSVP